MMFISNGDYNFPFDVHYYWTKLFYIWSYQSGSANPDGIIRMPGRYIDYVVFALFGNIPVSLFYLFSCLLIVFASFYIYSRFFLKIKQVWISIVAALLFTINPIFLGNVSKIGLVFAAAMLPLCLVFVQKAFEKRQLRYLLLYVACLNISLIHPFTFTVNIVISGGYLIYMAIKHRPYRVKNIPKLLLVGLVGVLLNAYFLLPIASLGSVNKDVLSSNVASAPTDYTSLIAVANTGDIFTGLSLAKGVLKDYEFFTDSTQLFYFLGIFLLYIILFGVYVRIEKRLSPTNRRYFIWSLAAFLVLLLLAAVNYLFVKDIIKLVVNLPGGWIFRSPLKWQLYIPFVIATMLAITMLYVTKKPQKIAVCVGLTISFLCMNSYISVDIANKLLTPRTIQYFSTIQARDMDQKNILIINDESCFSFATTHPEVMTELNQILVSKNVQVKQISASDADTVNLSSYDYILGCQSTAIPTLAGYDFEQKDSFVDNAFQLYENRDPKPYVYANQNVFSLKDPKQVGSKYELATRTFGFRFDFVDTSKKTSVGTVGLRDAYEDVRFGDIKGSTIQTSIDALQHTGKQKLYLHNIDSIRHSIDEQNIALTPGVSSKSAVGESKSTEIPPSDKLTFTYTDAKYNSVNIFPNPSLENGAWQQEVSDCYDYDTNGKVTMNINKDDKTEGGQSLQLEAQTHVACTGPDDITIEPNQNYLIGFDYKTLDGRFAAYHISFDDEAETTSFVRLDNTKGQWKTITKNIVTPPGAHTMKVLVYAYPDTSGITTGLARYDNFHLTAIPDIQNHFYVVTEPEQTMQQPKNVRYEVSDPTKTTIHIEGATSPFYLATKESYSPQWTIGVQGGATVSRDNHVRMNNLSNGWLIDPANLCGSGCTKNSDGSYDMTFVMEFAPQRWLYVGWTISLLTFAAVIGYFIYEKRYKRPSKLTAGRRR